MDFKSLYEEMVQASKNAMHFNSELIYQSLNRKIAELCLENDELLAIYHLTESHAVWEEFTTEFVHSETRTNHIERKCSSEVDVSQMLKKCKEMPKEWTIVQLTEKYSGARRFNISNNFEPTPRLFMTVFSCGEDTFDPFCVQIDKPKDKFGNDMEIIKELKDIINEQRETLRRPAHGARMLHDVKLAYWDRRANFDSRLKSVVRQVDQNWLNEWTSLLIGKFVDNSVEDTFKNKINQLLELCELKDVSSRTKVLFSYIVKGIPYNMSKILQPIFEELFPTLKNSPHTMSLLIKNARKIAESLDVINCKRHPVILILDKDLDKFPWEMLPIVQDHPVSRMSSLNLTYMLFNEHKHRIKHGMVSGINSENGRFLVNPGKDLDNMEQRIKAFLEYWMPGWKGTYGSTVDDETIEEYLTNCDIFTFFGHGSGEKYIRRKKVQAMNIKGVVLLFGCGSLKLRQLTVQVPAEGNHQNYLIACCPCVVGNLWEVTDRDEDYLSAMLLSTWIPSKATHWCNIDHRAWEENSTISVKPVKAKKVQTFEPELLRALTRTRKVAKFYVTQAAIIARGLPVKIGN